MKEDTTAQRLLQQLESPNERERAQAADQLQKMGHPKALEACIATINDGADILHVDNTAAARALVRIGDPALPEVVKLLASEDELTRLRAERVIEGITIHKFASEDDWRKWWRAIGYDYEKSPMENKLGIERLQDWVSKL